MRAEVASFFLRVVEVDEPAEVHALAGISLADFSEALRRRLYDQVVADYFAPQVVVEEGTISVPIPYCPDAAGLEVVYLQGRWLVTWNRLEIVRGSMEDRSVARSTGASPKWRSRSKGTIRGATWSLSHCSMARCCFWPI